MKLKISLHFLVVSVLLSALINSSCRKIDIHAPITVDSIQKSQSNEVIQKFFNTRLSNDENIKAIRNNILKQEKNKPFVERFVNYAGYPIWEKGIVKTGTEAVQNKTGQGKRDEKVIFIPMALDTQHRVNALLKVEINGMDTTFSMLYKWQYKKYGYSESKKFNNADQTALLFMGFESYVFGHKDFIINDSLLFHKKGDRRNKDTIHITSFNSMGKRESPEPCDCYYLLRRLCS